MKITGVGIGGSGSLRSCPVIKTNLRLYSEAPARAASQFVDMTAKTGMLGPSGVGGIGDGSFYLTPSAIL